MSPTARRGSPRSRIRTLFVSTYFPHDHQYVHGTYKRMDVWVDALSALGDLEFLFFVRPELDISGPAIRAHRERLEDRWGCSLRLDLVHKEQKPPLTRWTEYGPGITSLFRQRRFRGVSGPRQVQALERSIARNPDLVFAHRLDAICPMLRTDRLPAPVLFDLDDVEHVARFRNLREPPRWFGRNLHYLQLPALWWGERRAIQMSTRTFVCSEGDRRYLERQGLEGIEVLPNAVALPEPVAEPSRAQVLYLGAYDYRPNINAARRLALEIWPRIREKVPEAVLVLAGRHPEQLGARVRSEPGVLVPGFVDDLDALYRNTSVVCCPIEAGGGTRVKIIEAAAHARPVVATEIAAEGLVFEDGREILIRDSTAAIAEGCVRLLRDGDLHRDLGEAARRAVESHYSRTQMVDRACTMIRETLASKDP